MGERQKHRDRDRQASVGHLEIGGVSKREDAALRIMLCLLNRLSDDGVAFRDGKPTRTFAEWEATMNGLGRVSVMGADALYDWLEADKG